MATEEKMKLQAYRLFCQHCQALQKVMGWEGKPCWVTQYNDPEAICASAIDAVDGLFAYFHSQGVVVKVERELPHNPFERYPDVPNPLRPSTMLSIKEIVTEAYQDMLNDGWAAVGPLI